MKYTEKEFDADTGEESVTLSDVRQAMPPEEEAETSILQAIDDSGADGVEIDMTPPMPESVFKPEVKKEDGDDKLDDVIARMEHMHHVAGVTNMTERDDDEEQQNDQEHPHNSNLGKMNAATNAMVNNANILVRRKKKKKKPASINGRKSKYGRNTRGEALDLAESVTHDLRTIKSVLTPQGSDLIRRSRSSLILILILFAAAVIAFYASENACISIPAPTASPDTVAPSAAPVATGRRLEAPEDEDVIADCTTVSWFFLFLIRLIVTFYLAILAQKIIIDAFCLTSLSLMVTKFIGPIIILTLIQSKGWPFLITAWGGINFAMLYGDSQFARHWLYWQDWWDLFNENNPSGGFTSNELYRHILLTLVSLGIATAIKRVAFGLLFGKQSYQNFNKQVVKIMQQILLIGQVAHFSKQIELGWVQRNQTTTDRIDLLGKIQEFNPKANSEDSDDAPQVHELTGSQRDQIMELVGEWDEPRASVNDFTSVQTTLHDVIRFNESLASIRNDFPFSASFGYARTREACLESSCRVFRNLQAYTNSSGSIPFDTVALSTLDRKGNLHEGEIKQLIRIFRPDRDGTLTLLHFVKSIDNIYKEMRLLQASVDNSKAIDDAAERIYNILYYFLYILIIQMGLFGAEEGLEMIFGLFALITPLSFALSSACGKYVEGVMLILTRKPFQIGDRIAVSGVETDTSSSGSSTWFVEHVDLFTTTVRFSLSNEVATVSNWSLAGSRIINAKRSPNAVIRVTLRFNIRTPPSKLDTFYEKVMEYAKEKPREFLQVNGLSPTSIEVQHNYVQYVLSAQHHESWQNGGAVWKTTVDLTKYCLELTEELEMTYVPPTLPVQLHESSDNKNWFGK